MTDTDTTENESEEEVDENTDAPLVGTPAMVQSPNVSLAPLRVNSPVPRPSVYRDERGEIHNISLGQDEVMRINLLYTREGVMRSGDIHANTQHDFIFSGLVEFWLLTSNENQDEVVTKKTLHGPGDYIIVPPYTPHVFHFIQDTVMAEWWEPGSFFAWFYHPYRKLVEQSFTAAKPGKLQLLIPKYLKQYGVSSLVYATMAGVALGFGASFLLSAVRQTRK